MRLIKTLLAPFRFLAKIFYISYLIRRHNFGGWPSLYYKKESKGMLTNHVLDVIITSIKRSVELVKRIDEIPTPDLTPVN